MSTRLPALAVLAAGLSSKAPEGPGPGLLQVAHAGACCWLTQLGLGLWLSGWGRGKAEGRWWVAKGS